MRINKFVARATGIGRRRADELIKSHQVKINGIAAKLGDVVSDHDQITVNNKAAILSDDYILLMLNKPIGYVSSRRGQGSQTVYELLPDEYKGLKTIGRLDKNTSGLLLL